jgi:hypothetical protein
VDCGKIDSDDADVVRITLGYKRLTREALEGFVLGLLYKKEQQNVGKERTNLSFQAF